MAIQGIFFTVNLYKMTAKFPSEERYGLTNQIRRATCGQALCVSIESNISEGCGRDGDKEFSRFLEQRIRAERR